MTQSRARLFIQQSIKLINNGFWSGSGRPVPKVVWYENNQPVESRLEFLPDRRIQNILHIKELGRVHHGARYSCAASNSRILAPLVTSVTILLRRKYLIKLLICSTCVMRIAIISGGEIKHCKTVIAAWI